MNHREPRTVRVIRLTDPKQFAESVDVQRDAWGLDEAPAVPAHVMIAGQQHSGLVLGAYVGRRMVGVLFGFTALDGNTPYHYSHITGVLREYQSKGVGFRLKLAQRKHVIRRGQSVVRWTYDPLQAGNAVINIGKLGAVCRTYNRNMYGALDDSLNRGRLTDRFMVEWWVNTRRVLERIRGKRKPLTLQSALATGAEPANVTEELSPGVRRIVRSRLNLNANRLLVEIPEDIVRVAEANPRLATSWTLTMRRICERYFSRGYVASDVVVEGSGDGRRVFYLFEK